MSPDNLTNKEESGTNRKPAATTTRPAELQALKCPRCDSPNTKFCYYNNCSLTQPRHFCKTCRRYWTKGGALRNIPIGGGCRKNKKIGSKPSNSSRFSPGGDSKDSAGSSSYYSDISGLKFFNGISPAMDFQLGGLGLNNNNFPRIFHSLANTTGGSNSYNQHYGQLISSFGEMISTSSTSCFGIDPIGNSSGTNNLMGFNFPLSSSSVLKHDNGNGAGGIFVQDHNNNSNLASSIESLSSINQDLHWKLQQERLAMLFDDQNQAPQKLQPILFQNLDSSKPDAGVGNSRKDNNNGSIGIGPTGNLATEWFFGNSNYSGAVNFTPTNSSINGNGIHAWSNFNQYTPLP